MEHARSQTVNRTPQVQAACRAAQERNHAILRERWAHYLNVRRFDYPIVLKRSYAIGDVLLTTPIIRALSKSNPLSQIHIETDFPEIFLNHPAVTSAAKAIAPIPCEVRVNLDMSYERFAMEHIVSGYEMTTRREIPGMGGIEMRTDMYVAQADRSWALSTLESLCPDGQPLACIGSDPTTWAGKNWPEDRFMEIRRRLEDAGWKTVAVGSKRPGISTSIQQLAALLQVSRLFVGNDSFPLHAAQAVGCPVVGVFGATLPRFILTHGSKASAACADPSVPCAGERHRSVGKTHVPCGGDCINSVTVNQVWEAIRKLEVL